MAWVNSNPSGRLVETWSEEATGDQDKSFAVSSEVGGETTVKVLGIRIEYTADATVSTRELAIEMQDSAGDVIYGFQAPSDTDVTASATEILELRAGLGRAFVTGRNPDAEGPHTAALGEMYLAPGDVLRVRASAGGQAGDNMIVHLRLMRV